MGSGDHREEPCTEESGRGYRSKVGKGGGARLLSLDGGSGVARLNGSGVACYWVERGTADVRSCTSVDGWVRAGFRT